MNNIKALKEIYRKLIYVLNQKERRKSIFIVLMLIVGSMLETLGVSAILPFVESVLSPADLYDKWYAKILIDLFHINNSNTIMILLGVCIIVIYFLKNIYLYFENIIQTVFRSKIMKRLSTKMLRTYMEKDYEYYTNINTSEIIRGIGLDVTSVFDMLDNVFRCIGELFTALLLGIYILYTDMIMSVCVICIAGMCFIFITLGLKNKTRELSENKKKAYTECGNCSYQAIMGFKEVKVTQTTDYFIASYEKAYEKQRVSEVNNSFITNLPERVIESFCISALIGTICMKIAIGTDMTEFAPKMAIFAMAAFRMLPSVSRITRYMNGIIYGRPYLESVYQNIYQMNESSVQTVTEKNRIESSEAITFGAKLQVQNISWKYQTSEKRILEELSLDIHKGESIALIGASGAGKSTLADILLGLLKPQTGEVLLDGEDIFRNKKAWSEIIGYVPQTVFLTDDTVLHNVAFGQSDDEINVEQVWNALEQAQLAEFIRKQPDGLETQVGERGIKFSGGQRQRIAIARALYRNPEIIVLDEATSALDNETESAVMESIEALQGTKTLIIVAHRLSTVRKCDKIYEIQNGLATLIDKNTLFKE